MGNQTTNSRKFLMSHFSAAQGRISFGAGLNLLSTHAPERNLHATIYVGNIDSKADAIICELFTQVGPVAHVFLPKDRVTGNTQGFGFVEFRNKEDAQYAIKIINMIRLYGKPLRVSMAMSNAEHKKLFGSDLFIGNLSQEVDEKVLFDTFSAFGLVLDTPKIIREPETSYSKGHGFISFHDFEVC